MSSPTNKMLSFIDGMLSLNSKAEKKTLVEILQSSFFSSCLFVPKRYRFFRLQCFGIDPIPFLSILSQIDAACSRPVSCLKRHSPVMLSYFARIVSPCGLYFLGC